VPAVTDARYFLPNLIRWEGSVAWMYRDSAAEGNVTTGIGCLIPSSAAALALPWMIFTPAGPINASVFDVTTDRARVLRLAPGMVAAAYRAPSSVELLQTDIEALAVRRLEKEFFPGLRELCPGFDAFPEPAQSAMVDMIYNLGEGSDSTPVRRATGLRGFPTMIRYANEGRWADCALECHRKPPTRDERNDWTRAQFLAASEIDGRLPWGSGV
jgi:GH24 family phage-related lysozyme (muramidase)